tara:strand:+ start:191 stop:628 length:438 start_codon:yes stop_codon:yes gene_type:complete
MVTRFAGNRIEDFMSPGVRFDDMGADAVGSAAADFGEAIIGNARVRNAELLAKAEEEAAKANADASRAASNAAQGANTIGTIAGAVGGIGSAAIMGGGGDPGGYPGSVNSPGFGMDQSKQIKFGDYGGSVGGYGTYGPNWGFPSA